MSELSDTLSIFKEGDMSSLEGSIDNLISRINNVREKISLVMDTCCFASVDLSYDEFDELTRELEAVANKLREMKDNEGGGLLESP